MYHVQLASSPPGSCSDRPRLAPHTLGIGCIGAAQCEQCEQMCSAVVPCGGTAASVTAAQAVVVAVCMHRSRCRGWAGVLHRGLSSHSGAKRHAAGGCVLSVESQCCSHTIVVGEFRYIVPAYGAEPVGTFRCAWLGCQFCLPGGRMGIAA
jgi:hypothetical protein